MSNIGQALAILRACRRAMGDGGLGVRLAIVERLLDAPGAGVEASLSDLNMLVNTGGRERTSDDYATLLRSAGLGMQSTVTVEGCVTLMSAAPLSH